MDLAEDENFAFKHPYFFENFTFHFEGLKSEIKEKFEHIVKSMGATVSDYTKYVFTDILRSSLDTDNILSKYYSLSYFSDSITAEKPLDIENYKFTSLIHTSELSFCCQNAKLILKNRSCRSYYNQYYCCKLCMDNKSDKLSQENNNFVLNPVSDTTDSIDICDFNTVHLTANSSDSTHNQNYVESSQQLTNGASYNEIHESNTDSNEFVEKCNINQDKPSCSMQGSKKLKVNKKSSIVRWKRKRVKPLSSDSDLSSKSAEIRRPTKKQMNKRPRISSSSSPETVDIDSSSDCEYIPHPEEVSKITSSKSSSSEAETFVERLYHNRKKWWLCLPTVRNPDPNYKDPESKCRGRGRDYTWAEKQLMIAYLVVNDKINQGTSRKPWKEMHMDGYLQDRSSESLNNHYRKVLLPNIEHFKLPQDIEKEFIEDRRRCHIARAQK